MKYISIDMGSSTVKSAIVDTNLIKIFEKHSVAVEALNNDDRLCHEVSADRLFQIVKKLIDEYIEHYKNEIDGILLSTQMHGFLFCDQNAKAITPYISWQDNR